MEPDTDDAERFERRKERLRVELQDEGIPVLGAEAFPDPLKAQAGLVEDILLQELVYARHAPVHEGIRPTYGCLIVEEVAVVAEQTISTVELGQDVSTVRPFIDGGQAVLVRDLQGRSVVARLDIADELNLVRTASDLNAVTAQRLPGGRIRTRTQRHVLLNDGYDWTVRPQARNVIPKLATALRLPGAIRLGMLSNLRGLLEFCFHRLSPRGIGATLIVMMTDTTAILDATSISDPGATPSLPINVFTDADHQLLLNLLESIDGACQIESDGTLTRYMSKLHTPGPVNAIIAEHGGTRHTSAKRFSYYVPQALVIVVSADGPITIFIDGVPIITLDNISEAGASYLTDYPLDQRGNVENHDLEHSCERCNRHTRFEYATDPEVPRSEMLTCPVCAQEVIEVEHMVEARSHVLKVWEAGG